MNDARTKIRSSGSQNAFRQWLFHASLHEFAARRTDDLLIDGLLETGRPHFEATELYEISSLIATQLLLACPTCAIAAFSFCGRLSRWRGLRGRGWRSLSGSRAVPQSIAKDCRSDENYEAHIGSPARIWRV
jgi:hypothetical protein